MRSASCGRCTRRRAGSTATGTRRVSWRRSTSRSRRRTCWRSSLSGSDRPADRRRPAVAELARRGGAARARRWRSVSSRRSPSGWRRASTAAGLYDFDDMLDAGERRAAAARAAPSWWRRCGSRFRLAIVDEFQDTDPIQWADLPDDLAGRALPSTAIQPPALSGRRSEAGDLWISGRRRGDLRRGLRQTVAAAAEAHHLTRNFRSTAPSSTPTTPSSTRRRPSLSSARRRQIRPAGHVRPAGDAMPTPKPTRGPRHAACA